MRAREDRGKAWIRECCFEEIAEVYGTPFYLYDVDFIRKRIDSVRRSFRGLVELFYAVKANPNLEILRAIRDYVEGLDISSAGELEQSLIAGYRPEQLSFAGPGKTREELERAMELPVGILSVESLGEIQEIAGIASTTGRRANIVVRINPRMQVKEFAVKMGGRPTQFGIDEERFAEVAARIRANEEALHFLGIHVYAGTQCLDEDAIIRNMQNTLAMAEGFEAAYGLRCELVNLGGGFGVSYYGEGRSLQVDLVGEGLRDSLEAFRAQGPGGRRVLVELGRYLIAEAGIYVARVIREKRSRGETFIILDGGMNHHLAASGQLGAALRRNYTVKNLSDPGGPLETCNLVGPLCTPLDLLGQKVSIPSPKVGHLIGILNSGSYGFTASPLLFLGHETPVELMVEGGKVERIRPRWRLSDFNDSCVR